MSKVFAVSLTTILMLVSLTGPMQPVSFADDAPPEMNPVTDELSVNDQTSGEEAVQDQEPKSIDPAAEEAPVEANQEELAPADTPDQTANSPPAGDESDAEQGSDDAESSMIVVPNAVNPDPGTCGGIGQEPCPGGSDPVSVTVGLHATSLEGINTVVIPGATFTVSDGSTAVGTFTGNHNGYAEVSLVSGKLYSVVVAAAGYDTEPAYSITPSDTDDYFSFMLHKSAPATGTLTFEVIDSQTKQPLWGANVKIVVDSTWSPVDSGSTSSNGIWTSKELVAGKYMANISKADYHAQVEIEVNIPSSTTITIEMERFVKSPISLKFVDAETGEPLEGARFLLNRVSIGSDVEGVSNANGEFVTEPLVHANYGISVTADGYSHIQDYRFQHSSDAMVIIELEPLDPAKRTYRVVDAQTFDPVPHAYITILSGDFSQEIAFGITDQNGEWTTPELPAGYYAVTIYPVSHYPLRFTTTMVSGNHTTQMEVSEFKDVGYLNVQVNDVTYGTAIEDTKITVREKGRGTVATGFTDANGKWTIPHLPAGSYAITVEKSGYTTSVIEFSKDNADYHLDIELHRSGQFNFRLWLLFPKCSCTYSEGTFRPVGPGMSINNGLMPMAFQVTEEFGPLVGATAQLLNPVTLDVIAEKTSDDAGLVGFGEVAEGRYLLRITGDRFPDYTHIVELTGDLELTFVFEPADDPDVTIPGDNNDDEETPDTGNPDEGSNPDTGNPDEGSDPDTGGDESGDDNDVAESEEATNADPVAQSSGTSSGSTSVNQLPNTGTGESNSHVGIAALTLVAAFGLLSALGIRRRI